jgi:glycosyltransferase involved in cell wall biosynthesis
MIQSDCKAIGRDRDGRAPARISVVMPLYDKAPFVEAAIRSTLDNGPGIHEVIVVDDGSRDAGPAIVAAIDDPRIRLIRKANGGVSSARNVGLDVATGDWIAFLDADDLWLPGYVDAIQSLIAGYPGCEMVTTCYVMQDDSGKRTPVAGGWDFQDRRPRVLDDFYETMSLGHFCFTGSVVIHRDLIQRAGLRFPVGEQLGEDLEVTFGAAERTSVAVDPRPLVVYRDTDIGVRLSRRPMPILVIPFFQRLDRRLQGSHFPSHLRAGAENYLRSHLKRQIYHSIDHQQRRHGWRLVAHRLVKTRPKIFAVMALSLLLPASLVRQLRTLKGMGRVRIQAGVLRDPVPEAGRPR